MHTLKSYLGKTVTVTVDRKLGSKHPEWNFVYPVNYGYIAGTKSGDGEEIDAYILGISEPVEKFKGICIAIIERLDDNDPKLIVALKGKKFSKQEIEKQIEFQEKYFTHMVVR